MTNRNLSALLFLLLNMLMTAATAQVAAKLVQGAELQDAEKQAASLIPPGIKGPIQTDSRQVFRIEGGAFPAFTMVPIRYLAATAAGGSVYRCGVVMLSPKSAPYEIRTIGYAWTEAEQCAGVEAVGFMQYALERPRLLLLYRASTRNASLKEPLVIDWDASAGAYVANEKLSSQLEDEPAAATISGMRKILSAVGRRK